MLQNPLDVTNVTEGVLSFLRNVARGMLEPWRSQLATRPSPLLLWMACAACSAAEPGRDSLDRHDAKPTLAADDTAAEPLQPCAPKTYDGDYVTYDSVPALAALEGVTVVTGDLYLLDVDAAELENLACLEEVGGTLSIAGSELENLRGFWRLRTIQGDFVLRAALGLKTLEGVESLTSIGGDLHIKVAANLRRLTGLERMGWLRNPLAASTPSRINSAGSR